jgi:hypothetical protein
MLELFVSERTMSSHIDIFPSKSDIQSMHPPRHRVIEDWKHPLPRRSCCRPGWKSCLLCSFFRRLNDDKIFVSSRDSIRSPAAYEDCQREVLARQWTRHPGDMSWLIEFRFWISCLPLSPWHINQSPEALLFTIIQQLPNTSSPCSLIELPAVLQALVQWRQVANLQFYSTFETESRCKLVLIRYPESSCILVELLNAWSLAIALSHSFRGAPHFFGRVLTSSMSGFSTLQSLSERKQLNQARRSESAVGGKAGSADRKVENQGTRGK